MTREINHQKFYKNVMAKEHKVTILIDLGKLPDHIEVLMGELHHVDFKVYGHNSSYLALLNNVELMGKIDVDDQKTYSNIDFVVTNNEEVAIRGQLSGVLPVDDLNKAIKAYQEVTLDNVFRLSQYEEALKLLTSTED